MNALLISLLVFALIFGGALVGVVVRPLLSEEHLHPDSKDVVKMATGLIGTLAALVLGLLIASAKSSFDQKTSQVKQMTTTIILLDDLLAQYGPEATPARNLLRRSIQPLANRIWQEEENPNGKLVHFESSAEALAKMNCSACRRRMMLNVPCNLAPFRPSRTERKPGCSCLLKRAAQFRLHF
jgi:hypothetical protein